MSKLKERSMRLFKDPYTQLRRWLFRRKDTMIPLIVPEEVEILQVEIEDYRLIRSVDLGEGESQTVYSLWENTVQGPKLLGVASQNDPKEDEP